MNSPMRSPFRTPSERQMSPLDEAITHLNADPRLAPDARTKLTSVLTQMYNALARDLPATQPVMACHLRAASVMRPGVPHRLAGILTDMHRELQRRIEAGEL